VFQDTKHNHQTILQTVRLSDFKQSGDGLIVNM
jgi:hypothetical protein